jgi:hypothetical protein
MTTRIVLTNENTFILCQNWPDEPYLDTEPGIWEYAERKNESLAAGLVISNPEVAEDICWRNDYRIVNPISLYDWKRVILRPGDSFPVPDSVGWEKTMLSPCWKVRKCLIANAEGYENCDQLHGGTCTKLDWVATLFIKSEPEKIFVDGDFNDGYEARVKRSKGKGYDQLKKELESLRSQLEEKDKLLLQETGKAMRYSQTIADLQSQLSKAKDKEIRGDRMIVDLEHKLTVEKTHNSRLVEGLKIALDGPYHNVDDAYNHLHSAVKAALSPQPAPEPEEKIIDTQDDGGSEVFKGGITTEQAASFRNFGAASPSQVEEQEQMWKEVANIIDYTPCHFASMMYEKLTSQFTITRKP